ncbi:uncharacterized protein LOC116936768 [Daphnia magna]|uniref:uncharacterized protein LOC116936768 n=1 Tax=Daphnia magna TaxID=35525 RepID=UPI001E1BC016|nr:uncharacterized protein LOC116936768 [Daphnia magna]
MPPKRVAVVAPVDYHIRTRNASRNLIPVVVTPRVVALIPHSDSESEERPSRRLNFDISPVREEPEQVNVPVNMDPDLAQALAKFANGAAQDRAQYQGHPDALMNLLAAQQQESAALRALPSTLPPVPMHPPPVPTPLPPAAPHIDVGSALLSLIAGLTERLNGLTLGGGQRQMQRQPDNRSCFQCGAIGHIKRNCPRGAGNGQAPSAGPGQH